MYPRILLTLAVCAYFISIQSVDAKFRIKISRHGVEVGPIHIPPPPPLVVLNGIKDGKSVDEIARDTVKQQVGVTALIPQAQTLVENIAVAKLTKILGKEVGEAVEIILFPQQIQRAGVEVAAKVAKDLIDGKRPDEILGIPLAAAITQAKQHYIARSKPLPPQVQYMLSTTFRPEILRSARYVVDDFGGNVPAIINKLQETIGNEHAVTIDDIIVFSREPKHENIFLWAHELAHVEQYRKLGIEGFAARYTTNWGELERDADKRAREAEQNAELIVKVFNALAMLQKE